MSIRVAIFDDNAKRREALTLLLQSSEGIEYAGAYNDCRKVVHHLLNCKPDVVLMDIDMPHVNGIEGLILLRPQFPHIKVLMQTVFEDDEKVFAAICAGANGYILKQATAAKLLEGITEVTRGGAPMTPLIAKKVLEFFASKNAPAPNTFHLTKREKEVLKYLVRGFSYKMIATECFISYATVNSHISKIYEKLQVNSSAAAVALAIRERLV
jgi:DNA-binding NarL/FixJ family response regulator